MGIFTQNRSMAASMICALVQKYGWDVDILFVPPSYSASDMVSIQEEIRVRKPDLMGLSFASYERKQAFAVATIVKQMGVPLIAGGIHATALPSDLVDSNLFSGIVVGDGMGVMKYILDSYTTFRDNQLIIGAQHSDKRVYLDYFFSESQEEVLRTTKKIDMMTSIGCPFSCRYCGSGRKTYFKNPEDYLIETMVSLAMRYGIKIFTFQDDLLFASVKRVRAISSALEKKFPGQSVGFGRSINARASSFTEQLAEELVKLKVTDVSFGIESASNKLLKFLNKKQTEEDCYSAIKICKKYGLFSRVNLIYGIPFQDEEDYEITKKFIQVAKPDVVNLFYFTPYPGTDLYDFCFENGFMPDHCDRNRFDWFDPTLEGIRGLQCTLKQVDYESARKFQREISKMYSVSETIRPAIQEIDVFPWFIIGSSVQEYFSQVLHGLNELPLKNCLGYVDIEPEGAYSVTKRVHFTKYDDSLSVKPKCAVTYSHMSSLDYQLFRGIVSDKFGEIPLISISSLKRHSINEIRSLLAL
ncbi:MAG: hypothetical protein BWK78_00525 [Thiotrichaceae bacterium IS1]|nr:MAG: hypothetical protein BWK78_00525 [Thiotrichaceae bacterium IS1]